MWAYETTFYQIYPLGFCGAPRENAAPVAEDELAQAANAAPNPDAPIMKIAQWADYLQELGVGAVLINPPLESDSHGYDTRSLRHIDRRLGGDADFAAVLAKAAQLRDTYNVTVLPQAKKLGKQLGQLEASGFAGAAFMDKDEVKIFAQQ